MRRILEHVRVGLALAILALILQACGDGGGGGHEQTANGDPVLRWNEIALDASRLDHTAVRPGEQRTFGEQLGPTGASRAFAMIHIAMADAVAMIDGSFETFFPEEPAPRTS